MKHLLLEHLENCEKYLLAYSEAIGIADHTVNLGSAREALITNFLKNNLPTAIDYSTGELFDFKGKKSGQIDIILTPSTAPRLNLFGDYNLVPSDTTLGVIEVKSKLTTGSDKNGTLSGALKNCCKVKALEKINGGQLKLPKDITLELNTVPYIVFAYDGAKKETILKNIQRYASKEYKTFKCMPDLIVVLKKGYYLTKTQSWMSAGNKDVSQVYRVTEAQKHALLGLYSFILSVSEHLSISASDFKMPFREYTEKINNLFDVIAKLD